MKPTKHPDPIRLEEKWNLMDDFQFLYKYPGTSGLLIGFVSFLISLPFIAVFIFQAFMAFVPVGWIGFAVMILLSLSFFGFYLNRIKFLARSVKSLRKFHKIMKSPQITRGRIISRGGPERIGNSPSMKVKYKYEDEEGNEYSKLIQISTSEKEIKNEILVIYNQESPEESIAEPELHESGIEKIRNSKINLLF